MSEPTKQLCPDCRWWRLTTMVSRVSKERLGNCVARSPMIYQQADLKFTSKWPITSETDFCGSFEVAEQVEAANV